MPVWRVGFDLFFRSELKRRITHFVRHADDENGLCLHRSLSICCPCFGPAKVKEDWHLRGHVLVFKHDALAMATTNPYDLETRR